MTSELLVANGGLSPIPFTDTKNNGYGKNQKKKIFVKACCARCNEYITNWIVRTTREEEYYDLGSPNDDNPLKKYLNHYEHSDLYPSYLSCTYLGPEHVMTFPCLDAANLFLARALELDMEQVRSLDPLLPSDSMKINKDGILLRAGGKTGLTDSRSSDESKCDFQGLKITCGLVCPKCQYLLASSPTNRHLGLKGRVVIYKSSLTLTSSNIPFSDLSAVEELPQGSQGNPSLATQHDELVLIHSREQFEDILLRSAISDLKQIPDNSSFDGEKVRTDEQQREKKSPKPQRTGATHRECIRPDSNAPISNMQGY